MPSRSSLFGGADIWHPNNVIPGTGPSEELFFWYDPVGQYTSRPYPYIYVEALGVVAGLDALSLRIQPSTLEYLDLTPALLDLDLRAVLLSYTGNPEYLDLIPAVDDIDLRVALISYVWPPDFLELEPNITDLVLRVAIIFYTNWPSEHIDLTANLDGVTLI